MLLHFAPDTETAVSNLLMLSEFEFGCERLDFQLLFVFCILHFNLQVL